MVHLKTQTFYDHFRILTSPTVQSTFPHAYTRILQVSTFS